jgi:glutamate 5-kinase
MHPARAALTKAQRIVVKVGSRAIAGDRDLVRELAAQLHELDDGKRSFVVVSSGAIALGWPRLGYKKRPKEMPGLQASAAAGQSVLMQRYSEAFAATNRVAAQVLLTHSDLTDRERVNNARQALAALLEARAVPIINENDTVATEEIRFGDNDQLASMVTPLVGADLLLLLTDVEGVLDDAGVRIPLMQDDLKVGTVKTAGHGTGGIGSKIDAARKASRAGASVVIGSALHERIIAEVILGKDVGTLFVPHPSTLRARRHWIMYTLRPRGDVLLDDGAARAAAACSPWASSACAATSGRATPSASSRPTAPRSAAASRASARPTWRAQREKRAWIWTPRWAARAATRSSFTRTISS